MIVARWQEHLKHESAILTAIEDQRRADPHAKLGVGTGWSGPKTLFEDPRCEALRAWILETVETHLPFVFEVHGWGNVMEFGDRCARHDHRWSHLGGENSLAGVFFLRAPAGAARLLVEHGESEPLPLSIIEPLNGRAVIFLAATPHFVERHEISEQRVSVAFNMRRNP